MYRKDYGRLYRKDFVHMVVLGWASSFKKKSIFFVKLCFQPERLYQKGHQGVIAPLLLQAYYDSDWASCPTTRRLTISYITFLGTSPISWLAKK